MLPSHDVPRAIRVIPPRPAVDARPAGTTVGHLGRGDVRTLLRDKNLRHAGITRDGNNVDVRFRDRETMTAARNLLTDHLRPCEVMEAGSCAELLARSREVYPAVLMLDLQLGDGNAMELLEQLRALEHGYRIKVVRVAHRSIGVDTPEDAKRAEELLNAR